MLVAYSYWGFTINAPLYLKWIIGLGTPAIVIGLWAYFAAPNSTTRLDQPWLTLFQFVIFAGAAIALYKADRPLLAMILFGVWIICTFLAIVWKQ